MLREVHGEEMLTAHIIKLTFGVKADPLASKANSIKAIVQIFARDSTHVQTGLR
jgi:hypothetical protein